MTADRDEIFGDAIEGAAFSTAKAELDRMRALADRLRTLGAATAGVADAEARARAQDANLAAFEEASAAAAEIALQRMRTLIDTLRRAQREGVAEKTFRDELAQARRDVATARERENDILAVKIAKLLAERGAQAAGAAGRASDSQESAASEDASAESAPAKDQPPRSDRDPDDPVWEPFEG